VRIDQDKRLVLMAAHVVTLDRITNLQNNLKGSELGCFG